VQGDVDDHASLVAALKQVDVVISAVGGNAVLDGQLKLIAAIKEVGHILSSILDNPIVMCNFSLTMFDQIRIPGHLKSVLPHPQD
jgi:polysaccharide pyruvyl transferase WcaK-like protein